MTLLTLLLLLPAYQGKDGPPAPAKLDGQTRVAVDKALVWLAARQDPDGSWSDAEHRHNTAITSFAILAFLSDGHMPGRGRHGETVLKGARFLAASGKPENGCLVGARGGNGRDMYCHGMATLALSQLWGTGGKDLDESIRPVLERAVLLILQSQNKEGGWRYHPAPNDADISVTVMQVMALRAARNAGMHVPDHVLDKAITYINSCRDAKSGGYNYQPRQNAPEFARTAAGICVLHLCGRHSAEEIPQAVKYLETHFNSTHHFFYGHYYASHAMHQIGGKSWETWYSRLREKLLPAQAPDGSWPKNGKLDHSAPGPVYQTSIAVIALAVPQQFVPIYQR